MGKKPKRETCRWQADEDGNWETECGEMHVFTVDGPVENSHRFCPYCGAKLVVKPFESNR